jgi:hypothetical protein
MKTIVPSVCALFVAVTAIAEPPVSYVTTRYVTEDVKVGAATVRFARNVAPPSREPIITYHTTSLFKPVRMTMDVGSMVGEMRSSKNSFVGDVVRGQSSK